MRTLLTVGAAGIFLGFGAAGARTSLAADGIVEQVKQKVYELTGKDTATLNFKEGSSEISDADKATLKETMNAVRENGPVKEVLVVGYADSAYPHNQKDDLPKASRDLAAKRADLVKSDLETLGATNVRTYNMAEKAGWFEKTFVTSDAQIKREAVEHSKADADDDFYQALGQKLKSEGGAGKVIVVIRRDGTYAH